MKSRRRTTAILFMGLAACSTANDAGNTAGVRDGALSFSADTRILESFPVQLGTGVRVTNTGSGTEHLELPGGCPVQLIAYRDSQRTQVAWDQSRVLVCTLQLQMVDLEPRASRTFEGRADAREILGDSLPDGQYHLSAVMNVNQRRVEIPAGSAPLAVPR